MQTVDVSIIFPVRNLENELPSILEHIVKQTGSFTFELLIVDMGSEDATVATSLRMIHHLGISGCVVQNGKGSPAAALNSGIQRAKGKYITFVFARRLYRNVLGSYWSTAELTGADIVFGSTSQIDSRLAERQAISRVVKKKSGTDYMQACFEGKLYIDMASLLLRRQFLLEHQLWFTADCRYGYAEEFVCRCLMRAQEVVQSPVLLERVPELEWNAPPKEAAGRDVFQEIEAMLRVRDILWCEHPDCEELRELMDCQQLPRAVMHCIDILLRNGLSASAVKSELKKRSYHALLKTSKVTSSDLKKKIRDWKLPLHHYLVK